jgi:hypothetical protein
MPSKIFWNRQTVCAIIYSEIIENLYNLYSFAHKTPRHRTLHCCLYLVGSVQKHKDLYTFCSLCAYIFGVL